MDPSADPSATAALTAEPVRWQGIAWLAIAVRLAAMLITLLTMGLLVPRRNPLAGRWDAGAFHDHGLLVHVLLGGVRWDALWYLRIAREGYANEVKRSAFFPLYPLLIRGLSILTVHGWIAGTLISAACAIGAALVLQRIVRLLEPAQPRAASRAAVLWLLFPAGAFLGAVYPESLLCLLFGLCWLDALHDRPVRAGMWAGLALLTKPLGIAAFAFVLLARPIGAPRIASWRSWSSWLRWLDRYYVRRFWGTALGGAVAAIWPVYLWIRFGDPERFEAAQQYWNRVPTRNPWPSLHAGFTAAHAGLTAILHQPLRLDPAVVANLGDPVGVGAQDVVNFLAIALILAGAAAAWRWYGLGPGVFTLAIGIIPLLSASTDIPLLSAPRFALVALPLFVVLARCSVRWRAGDLLVVCSGLAFGLTACGLAAWQWLG